MTTTHSRLEAILRAGGAGTVRQLAEECGASIRTVGTILYRLEAQGVAVRHRREIAIPHRIVGTIHVPADEWRLAGDGPPVVPLEVRQAQRRQARIDAMGPLFHAFLPRCDGMGTAPDRRSVPPQTAAVGAMGHAA